MDAADGKAKRGQLSGGAGRRPEREARPACPACGGALVEIRAKLICTRCRTICEICCEGGPG